MKKKPIEPLSAHEEGILRATIDEAEGRLVDYPPKTVRRLLALIDHLRRENLKLNTIGAATDRINKFVADELDPATFKLASPFEPLLAIEKFDGPLPAVPLSKRQVLEHAVERIKTVHPDVDAWLHELAENANSVDMVERELLATLVRALANSITSGIHPMDHVTTIAFVKNPLDDNTFFLRMTTAGEKSERIVTRGECVAYLRETLAARAFDLNGRTIHGAELADLIERGALP